MVCGNVSAVEDNEGSLSPEDQSSIFHSIMEEDKGIVACLASEGQKSQPTALTDTRETTSPGEAHVDKVNTAEKSTSTVACVPTCDVMVATEATPSSSASTQSESPETVDRNIITEVHMADLDYLAGVRLKAQSFHHCSCRTMLNLLFSTSQEFIRIRTAQQKLRELNEKMKR